MFGRHQKGQRVGGLARRKLLSWSHKVTGLLKISEKKSLTSKHLWSAPSQTPSSRTTVFSRGRKTAVPVRAPFLCHMTSRCSTGRQVLMGIYKTDKEHIELGQNKYSRDLLTEEPTNLKTKEVSSKTQQRLTKDTVLCHLYWELWQAMPQFFISEKLRISKTAFLARVFWK